MAIHNSSASATLCASVFEQSLAQCFFCPTLPHPVRRECFFFNVLFFFSAALARRFRSAGGETWI